MSENFRDIQIRRAQAFNLAVKTVNHYKEDTSGDYVKMVKEYAIKYYLLLEEFQTSDLEELMENWMKV